MAKRAELNVEIKIVYVPLPPEMVEVRRASLLMLLKWIREDLILNPEDSKNASEALELSKSDHYGTVRDSIFSLEDIAQRAKVAALGYAHAWFIGHDGSAQRVALGTQSK